MTRQMDFCESFSSQPQIFLKTFLKNSHGNKILHREFLSHGLYNYNEYITINLRCLWLREILIRTILRTFWGWFDKIILENNSLKRFVAVGVLDQNNQKNNLVAIWISQKAIFTSNVGGSLVTLFRCQYTEKFRQYTEKEFLKSLEFWNKLFRGFASRPIYKNK